MLELPCPLCQHVTRLRVDTQSNRLAVTRTTPEAAARHAVLQENVHPYTCEACGAIFYAAFIDERW